MQIRTPLRILRQHGYIHRDILNPPPSFAHVRWQGIWITKLCSLREMGVDMDDPEPGQMAASIGPIPVDGGDYLKFLIAIREIAEADRPLGSRLKRLREELATPMWGKFSGYPGHYLDEICDFFFPTFLSTVPTLPEYTAVAMWDVALDTPARIDQATDEQLLTFKGIGPAVLRSLRSRCAEIVEGRDQPLLDMVNREREFDSVVKLL